MPKKSPIIEKAESMSLEQIARLIYRDLKTQNETAGMRRLLSSDEEKALLDRAKALGQLDELNRLSKYFRVALVLISDLLDNYNLYTFFKHKLHDLTLLNVLLHITDFKPNTPDFVKEVFSDKETLGYTWTPEGRKPNKTIVNIKTSLSHYIKQHYIAKYMLDNVLRLTRVDFLTSQDKKDIKTYDDDIKGLAKFYSGSIMADDKLEPILQSVLKDSALNEEERRGVEERLLKIIGGQSGGLWTH